jgi:hypothetical protein
MSIFSHAQISPYICTYQTGDYLFACFFYPKEIRIYSGLFFCDNAYVESFHVILKKEEVYHTQYTDYPAAKLAMF